jgi:hypothetical protein
VETSEQKQKQQALYRVWLALLALGVISLGAAATVVWLSLCTARLQGWCSTLQSRRYPQWCQ